MATANKTKGQKEELITALYCRLSVDDDNKDMESNSITNQKQILQDFARREGYRNTQFFVDAAVIIGLKTLRLKKCCKFGIF